VASNAAVLRLSWRECWAQ